MKLNSQHLVRGRYKREQEKIVIEVAVRDSRQLFNERDPSPFRDRDLDSNFVTYVVSSVEDFPIKTPMMIRILVTDEDEKVVEKTVIENAIRSYFIYEAELTRAKIRKHMRTARFFLLVGLLFLIGCLSLSKLLEPTSDSLIMEIAREGLVIIGWVALWRPLEAVLYDWWPRKEQRQYLRKISEMDIDLSFEP